MKYGKGYIPDPLDHRRTPFSRHALYLLPLAVGLGASLRHYEPQCLDQGPCGSCTGHGTASMLYMRAAAQGAPLPFIPSPKSIYVNGRALDRSPDASGALPPLQDVGAMPNQVLRGIAEWGVRPMNAPTSDGRLSDCELSNVNDEPSLADLEDEAHVLMPGSYAIYSADDVCKALTAKIPVGIGCFVDTAFEEWDISKGPCGVPNPSDPNGGGHWISIVGYTTDSRGKRTFDVLNSWGAGWGDGSGHIQVTEDFVTAAWQLDAIDIRRV